jgi:hypothetical protein
VLTFILVLPDRDGEIVDSADSPIRLNFAKTEGETRYEVCARFEDSLGSGGTIYPVAAVDLTGYEDHSVWVAHQLCGEIDQRRVCPDFEHEVKNADGPLIAFGEPNIGPNGFII